MYHLFIHKHFHTHVHIKGECLYSQSVDLNPLGESAVFHSRNKRLFDMSRCCFNAHYLTCVDADKLQKVSPCFPPFCLLVLLSFMLENV